MNGSSGPKRWMIAIALILIALGAGGWLYAKRRDAAALPTARAAASATDPSDAAARTRPCSLLTRQEMEQLLGTKIVKITSENDTCAYYTDATMSVDVDSTWTGGKDAMTQSKGFNAAPGLFEAVPGIGDEAFMQAAGVLHVLKGDVYLQINARVYPDKEKLESAIAKKAIEKL